MYVSGTMNGYHTLDVGILIAPAITEFLVNVAKDYGVAYKISAKDPNKAKEQKERKHMEYNPFKVVESQRMKLIKFNY